jgi:hypothetical protein
VSVESVATRLQETALSQDLQSADWVVPTMQTIHILMIGVVFVSILMIALRVLGWARTEEPLLQVWRRFAPFLWTGVVVMALTGLVLILAEPVREVMALSFRIKMVLLIVGIVSAIAFGRSVRRAALAGEAAGFRPSPLIRLASLATIVLWLAIIFLGRAIAYDNAVWGSWSTAVLQNGGST